LADDEIDPSVLGGAGADFAGAPAAARGSDFATASLSPNLRPQATLAALDRLPLALLSAQASSDDLQLSGLLSFARGSTGSAEDDLRRGLRETAFLEEMDRVREEVRQQFDLDRTASISVASVTLGMSVLYVLWLIRGGVLVASYLSALPAWRMLDPLPVLERRPEEHEDDDDAELEPGAKHTLDPLRGFQ
jgi:hypothetical protein